MPSGTVGVVAVTVRSILSVLGGFDEFQQRFVPILITSDSGLNVILYDICRLHSPILLRSSMGHLSQPKRPFHDDGSYCILRGCQLLRLHEYPIR